MASIRIPRSRKITGCPKFPALHRRTSSGWAVVVQSIMQFRNWRENHVVTQAVGRNQSYQHGSEASAGMLEFN